MEQIKLVAQLNQDINTNSKPISFQVLRGTSDAVGLQALVEALGIKRVTKWTLLNYANGHDSSIFFWNGKGLCSPEKPPPGLLVVPLPDIPPF